MTKAKTGSTKVPKDALDIACSFGGVSIGEATARVAIRIEREHLNVLDADEVFVGRRLSVIVKLGRKDDNARQKELIETALTIEGSADVKGMAVKPSHISAALTFSKKDVSIPTLAKFAKGIGRLIVVAVAEIPDDAIDDDEGKEGSDAGE